METSRISVSILLVLMSSIFVPTALAQESRKKAAAETTSSLQSRYWYDGTKKRVIFISDSLIAQVKGKPEKIQKQFPNANAVATKRGSSLQLWKVPSQASMVLSSLRRENSGAEYSEIVVSGKHGGSIRAIPGGMVVVFDPTSSTDRIDDWLREKKLKVKRVLPLGHNYVVVDSPAGLETLELANSLVETGEVVSAFPDWWEPVAAQ